VPHRAAKGNVRLVFLTVAAFLISGSMTVSANPSTQEHLTSPQPVAIAIDILSPVPAGVSFVPYLSNLSAAIKRSLSAKLPESAANEKKGIVVIRLRVQKDGSFSDDAVAITTSSGKKDMDDASLASIRAAAPFGPVPAGYLGSSLELKFAFFYNIPPKPVQKSNPAPAP
jgi:TonB family protein